MITREEMHKIRLIRAGKPLLLRPMKRRRDNPDFPLKGTVVCASCKRSLTGSAPRGNGGRYYYYHCKNRACTEFAKSIPKATLEQAFISYLEGITPKEGVLVVMRESIKQVWKERGMSSKMEAERHKKTLATLIERKARISALLEDGTYSSAYGRERLAALENEVLTAQIGLNETRIEEFDIEAAIAYATHFASNLGRQWFDLAPELRARFQKLTLPNGVTYSRPDGFGTTKLGLIFEINRQSDGDLSRVVDLMGQIWNQFVVELREWRALQAAADRPSAA